MAAIGKLEMNLKDVGRTAIVPNDDVARLMYYLHCVTVGCGMDILVDDLVNYSKYYKLSTSRQDSVFKMAFEFSPDEFEDKTMHIDENITGSHLNKFYEVSAALNLVAVQRNMLLAGTAKQASKVMFCKKWLDTYYFEPMLRNRTRVLRAIGSKHCTHCAGRSGGPCGCTRGCERLPESACTTAESIRAQFINLIERAAMDHCNNCHGKGVRARSWGYRPF